MISYLANPQRFLRFERIASPIFAFLTLVPLAVGLWLSLIGSPADYQQGESVRIMYVHVPAAWCAMMAYTSLTVASFVSFVWRHNLADCAGRAFALCGAAFTFLALITGSLWGKPSWGTWWQWDGRMTSVLILFFIYIAYLAIWQMFDDRKRAARMASILAMVGFINIPIIKFSVEWWNTLHQPATISNIGAPGLPPEMLWPLIIMVIAYSALFGWLSLKFIRADIIALKEKRGAASRAATATVETL
ncbi:MAG: heme ABC transporter permease [Alphaproteobacteria bacterium]